MSLTEVARAVWRVGVGRPRVAIFGGVHGNELTGVEVVSHLVNHFSDPSVAHQVRGELTLAIGNPTAVDRHVRFIDRDLNRCFGEVSGDGLEVARGKRLSQYLEDLDVLVDLHATNKPSDPFVRLPGSLDANHFGRCEYLFLSSLPSGCNTVLWDPAGHIAQGFMSDEYALKRHVRGAGAFMCYESGVASDVTGVPTTTAALEVLFRRVGLLPFDSKDTDSAPASGGLREWRHFEIIEKFALDHRGFEWLNGHGQNNFQLVRGGEAYGRRLGGNCGELIASEPSYIIFPKIRALWAEGQALGWLARRIACPE